jgi:hypothetical protein
MKDAEVINNRPIDLSIRTLEEPNPDHVQPVVKDNGIVTRTSHAHFKGYLIKQETGMAFSSVKSFIKPDVHVEKSSINGYGVFADRDYIAGQTIEEFFCILTDTTTSTTDDWIMNRYLMIWDCDCDICKTNGKTLLIPTGYGALYNHANFPNAHLTFEKQFRMGKIIAIKDISKGEEITRYYGKEYESLLEKEPYITSRIDIPEGLPSRSSVKSKQEPKEIQFRSMIVPENLL